MTDQQNSTMLEIHQTYMKCVDRFGVEYCEKTLGPVIYRLQELEKLGKDLKDFDTRLNEFGEKLNKELEKLNESLRYATEFGKELKGFGEDLKGQLKRLEEFEKQLHELGKNIPKNFAHCLALGYPQRFCTEMFLSPTGIAQTLHNTIVSGNPPGGSGWPSENVEIRFAGGPQPLEKPQLLPYPPAGGPSADALAEQERWRQQSGKKPTTYDECVAMDYSPAYCAEKFLQPLTNPNIVPFFDDLRFRRLIPT